MYLIGYYGNIKDAVDESRKTVVEANETDVLVEAIIKDLKKKPRGIKDALMVAKADAIKGYNPYDTLAKLHEKAKKAVRKLIENEFQYVKHKEDKVTFSTNFIKDGVYVQPANGILEIGIHIYMPAKKGWLARLFTGSMGMWFGDIGVKSMREYVRVFAGDVFAKQVTKQTVSNAVAQNENEGKTSYFCCLKLPQTRAE